MNQRAPYGGGPELRIGEAERERAAGLLADHYAAGRITQEEHGERLDRIWAARTSSEIAPAFSDLPGPTGQPFAGRPTGPTAGPDARPGRAPWSPFGRMPWPLAVALVVVAVVVGLAHLPLILVGFGVWFFFLRGGGCGSARRRHHAWHGPRRW